MSIWGKQQFGKGVRFCEEPVPKLSLRGFREKFGTIRVSNVICEKRTKKVIEFLNTLLFRGMCKTLWT